MPPLDPCGNALQTEAGQYIAGAGCLSGYSERNLLSALLLAILSSASATHTDYEPVLACGESGTPGVQIPVLITYAFEQDGTIVTTYTDLTTNTPYVGPIVLCDDANWQVAEPGFFCDNDVQTLVRRDIFRDGEIVATLWTDLAGATVAAPNPGTLTPGACTTGTGTDVNVTNTNLDIRDLVFATDKVDVSGSTLGANSGVDIGDVTVNNAAGAAAVNIQDGGNSITVDGTVTTTIGSTGRTTTITTTSAAASTTAGIRAVTFIVTTGPITIDGETFGTGATLSISAPMNDTLNAIAYDATGGVLKILELN